MIYLQKTEITLLPGNSSISITWQCTPSLMECSRLPWSLRKRHRLKIQQMHSMSSMLLQMQIQCPSPLRQWQERRQKKPRLQRRSSRTWHTGQHKSEPLRGESGLPPQRGDWANKWVKTCPAWKVTCLSELWFALTLLSPTPLGVEEQTRMLPPHQHHLSGMKVEWG